MNYACLNEQEFALPKAQEYVRLAVYTLIGFFLPMLLAGPQILVGSIVNALLITTAIEMRNWKLLPLIIFPSLGALSRGLLFGPFTVFLAVLLPFIWLSNALLVLTIKKMYLLDSRNYWVTLLIGALVKSAFLYSIAFTLNYFGIIPTALVTAMGLLQFSTAIIGGVMSRIFVKTNLIKSLPI